MCSFYPQAALDVMPDLDPIGIFLKPTAARRAARLHGLGLLKPSATGHSAILLFVGTVAEAEEGDYCVPNSNGKTGS